MVPFAPQYGFLFEQDTAQFPGIGEMIEVLFQGQELAKQREALGLTQQEVADRAKINIRQYQRLENGERSIYSSSFRIGLNVCHALKIDPMFYCSLAHKEQEIDTTPEAPIADGIRETPFLQKKYVLYNVNEDGTPAEIIAVEYGTSIDAAFEQLSRAIRDDLTVCEKYKGCIINIFPYEATDQNCYVIDAAVIPSHGQSNIVVRYQVIESEPD